jgi:hypothetical protein
MATGDPILAVMPESQYAWTLDKNLTPVIAQLPSEDADDDPDTPTTPVAIPANEFAITVCPMRDGTVLVLYDDLDIADRSIVRLFDAETGEQVGSDVVVFEGPPTDLNADPPVTATLVRIGELGAYKSVMDIGCGRILTNDRTTHELIEVKVSSVADDLLPADPDTEDLPDAEIGMVVKRRALVVDPLDGAVNSAATRLLYQDGGSSKLWDLDEDAEIRTVVAA